MAAKRKQPIGQETIKHDLMNQLARNGVVGAQYESLVNDYMDMWETKNLLIDDIRGRGVKIDTMSAGGVPLVKKNDSVDQLTRINGQMLKLLSEIGIKPEQSGGEDDEL